ncbi:class I adenylate-forming enzyme family protein [Paucisalibacillus globulus]|uniref:class I adenylate-forming enzyme family protein n=1 Tax=Paucisalibacillus globulus TaxID=351095 RepID=UPI0004066E76|nr:long-chain-fatty-acid--CoA ligase [Paucisalibacillus globulus]
MNIPNLLAVMSRKYPNQEGILTPTERITYAEWNEAVNQLADSLSKLGVKKGDKVVLHMPNTKEFMYAYIAIQRIGALVVPINAKLVGQEILYILNHSDASVFMTYELLFEQVKSLPDTVKEMVYIKTGSQADGWLAFDTLLEEGSPEEIPCNWTEDDEASILYTSGTTGDPKGVLFTYRSILTVAMTICVEMELKPESRVLHMMPLSHSAPLHLFMIAGLYVGSTHVVVPTFTPDLLLETVSREKTTHLFGAPIAYLVTSKHPRIREYDLSSMKYWVYGGAPLAKEEVMFVKSQFNTDKIICVYGLTEAGPNGTLLGFDDHEQKAGSIGNRAALNCEIRLVDEKGNNVKQGEIGEIILQGEGNMKAYYKNDEKTKEVLKDGWLYTGDMAKQDEDGFFWVVDRKKDIIISGGVNIYPKEIENLLITHPMISDVAVVGVPNPDWGETVKAFLVVDGEIEDAASACKEFLQGKIADYKIPRFYGVLDALPRNTTGKLLKHQLRERVGN